jgi:nucleotide-binding universal stress UspA family protein
VGTPYQVIQETIESEKPGLVVMNIHGKGMIERVVLGSTAERVLRAASDKCAVLLIPPVRSKRQRKVAKPV